MNKASDTKAIVFVIDDDASVREAMQRLFRSIGLHAEVFASTAEFLQAKPSDVPCCLVLDVRLQELSGLDFQAQLAQANIQIPIIFMTGHGDIPMTVKAMKAGAIEFLPKPFREQDMLDAVRTRDRKRSTAPFVGKRNCRRSGKVLEPEPAGEGGDVPSRSWAHEQADCR